MCIAGRMNIVDRCTTIYLVYYIGINPVSRQDERGVWSSGRNHGASVSCKYCSYSKVIDKIRGGPTFLRTGGGISLPGCPNQDHEMKKQKIIVSQCRK